MNAFIVDTHPLVWFAAGRLQKLGRRARPAFLAFERGEAILYVPAPVAIETWFLVRNGTLRPRSSFGAWWQEIARPELVHVELTHADVLAAAELDWAHTDPFDRMIVATARRLGVPLLTGDAAITDWGGVTVEW